MMDKFEAMYWVAILREAAKGDEEAEEMLRQENEARTESNLPTVQEELAETAEEARIAEKVEMYKQKLRQQKAGKKS